MPQRGNELNNFLNNLPRWLLEARRQDISKTINEQRNALLEKQTQQQTEEAQAQSLYRQQQLEEARRRADAEEERLKLERDQAQQMQNEKSDLAIVDGFKEIASKQGLNWFDTQSGQATVDSIKNKLRTDIGKSELELVIREHEGKKKQYNDVVNFGRLIGYDAPESSPVFKRVKYLVQSGNSDQAWNLVLKSKGYDPDSMASLSFLTIFNRWTNVNDQLLNGVLTKEQRKDLQEEYDLLTKQLAILRGEAEKQKPIPQSKKKQNNKNTEFFGFNKFRNSIRGYQIPPEQPIGYNTTADQPDTTNATNLLGQIRNYIKEHQTSNRR